MKATNQVYDPYNPAGFGLKGRWIQGLPGKKVRKSVARSVLAAVFVCALAMVSPAQTGKWEIDSGHSTASLTLGSSWNVGIAKVSGTVKLDEHDSTKDVFNLSIYPAGQGRRLLSPDGSFKRNGFANLSRYTVMRFQSKRATLALNGRLEFTGDLTITYVERGASTDWGRSHGGPEYGELIAHSATHEVTFIVETPSQGIAAGQLNGRNEISASATITRKDFPGLRTALSDAVWPIVVEDEDCQMPLVVGRDYRGALCTGTPVLVATPGPDGVTTPVSDKATILVHLHVIEGSSGRHEGPS